MDSTLSTESVHDDNICVYAIFLFVVPCSAMKYMRQRKNEWNPLSYIVSLPSIKHMHLSFPIK